MKLTRTRLGTGGQPTVGVLVSRDGTFTCHTLERSVDGDHCCIPAGTYPVVRDIHHPASPNWYACPELRDVPNRSEIQIHIANTVDQLRGCIAVGEAVDGDFLCNSHHAFQRLMTYLDGAFPFTLEIVDP